MMYENINMDMFLYISYLKYIFIFPVNIFIYIFIA